MMHDASNPAAFVRTGTSKSKMLSFEVAAFVLNERPNFVGDERTDKAEDFSRNADCGRGESRGLWALLIMWTRVGSGRRSGFQ